MSDRNLIEYLPLFVQKYTEIKAIMDTEQVTIDELWESLQLIMDNQYIPSATEYGVGRWEKILSIVPKPSDTLEERKFRLLLTLNTSLPYTYRRLREMLTGILGEENVGYVSILYPSEYRLIVKLALANTVNYQSVSDMLRVVCPANLTVDTYIFNTHKVVHRLRHSELRKFTHVGVRVEVLV